MMDPSGFLGSFSSAGVRVRSGLIASQVVPPFTVLVTNCVPRYRTCGSCGEKAMGIFQWKRYLLPNEMGAGEMSRTCPVFFDMRTTLPAGPALYTTSGSIGSGMV